jgi:hypothetical protein
VLQGILSFTLGGLTLAYPLRALLAQYGFLRNRNMEDVVLGLTAGYTPGHNVGEPSPEMCIVLLSARSNGALGFFDPVFKWVADSYYQMVDDLTKDPENGLINAETFTGSARMTSNRLLTIFYFRSTEHAVRFARRGLHKRYVLGHISAMFKTKTDSGTVGYSPARGQQLLAIPKNIPISKWLMSYFKPNWEASRVTI